MDTQLPSRVYLLHGMKRSGNHAISNWLKPPLQCSHANNVIPLGSLLRGAPFPEPVPLASWCRHRGYVGSDVSPSLLVTLEDHALQASPFKGSEPLIRRLLVLRDPAQMFSSRIRKAFTTEMPAFPRQNDHVMQRAVGLWKQHARCYLGEAVGYPGRVAILFDAWVSDRAYRSAICTALGVADNDSGFGRVTDEGGGSSFDGTSFDGRGHLMAVTDRVNALHAHEHDLLEDVLSDVELQVLQRRVMDVDPGSCLR